MRQSAGKPKELKISPPEETEEVVTQANAEPWSTKKKFTVAGLLVALIPTFVTLIYQTGHDEGMKDARVLHDFTETVEDYEEDLQALQHSAFSRREGDYEERLMHVKVSYDRLLRLDPSDLDEDILGTAFVLDDYQEALKFHDEKLRLIAIMHEHGGEDGDPLKLKNASRRYSHLMTHGFTSE